MGQMGLCLQNYFFFFLRKRPLTIVSPQPHQRELSDGFTQLSTVQAASLIIPIHDRRESGTLPVTCPLQCFAIMLLTE